MYLIYFIKNKVNGKYYIGQTNNFKVRISRHFSELKGNKHHSAHLQRAYNKYGEDNFEVEIFKNGLTKKEADNLEESLISEMYNTRKIYNVSKKARGGDLISYHPNLEEIKKKHSENAKIFWKNATEETKELFRINSTGKNNGMYGKTHSEEARSKISEALKGRKVSDEERFNASQRATKYHKKRKEEGLKKEYIKRNLHDEYEFVFNGKYYMGIESCVFDTGYSERTIRDKLLSENVIDVMSYIIYDPYSDNKISHARQDRYKQSYTLIMPNGEKMNFDYKIDLKEYLDNFNITKDMLYELIKKGKPWNPLKEDYKYLKGLTIIKN